MPTRKIELSTWETLPPKSRRSKKKPRNHLRSQTHQFLSKRPIDKLVPNRRLPRKRQTSTRVQENSHRSIQRPHRCRGKKRRLLRPRRTPPRLHKHKTEKKKDQGRSPRIPTRHKLSTSSKILNRRPAIQGSRQDTRSNSESLGTHPQHPQAIRSAIPHALLP